MVLNMCKNFLKTLNDVKDVMGEESVLKLLEGMSAGELFKLISKDKPVTEKKNDISDKMRKVVEARWAKKREGTATDTNVDTSAFENTNKISVSYVSDTRSDTESYTKIDTQNYTETDKKTLYENTVQKEGITNRKDFVRESDTQSNTRDEYVEPTKVHTENDLINVAETVTSTPVQIAVQETPSVDLQEQFNNLEKVAEEAIATNNPAVIKSFKAKLDMWYKTVNDASLISDVNYLTQRLNVALTELSALNKV